MSSAILPFGVKSRSVCPTLPSLNTDVRSDRSVFDKVLFVAAVYSVEDLALSERPFLARMWGGLVPSFRRNRTIILATTLAFFGVVFVSIIVTVFAFSYSPDLLGLVLGLSLLLNGALRRFTSLYVSMMNSMKLAITAVYRPAVAAKSSGVQGNGGNSVAVVGISIREKAYERPRIPRSK